MLLYDKKVSQKELATAAKVSEKTISKLVNGLQSVSVDTLSNIAEYLGVSVDELLK
jgi:transcriptional regulator with XRE-family HTH domain